MFSPVLDLLLLLALGLISSRTVFLDDEANIATCSGILAVVTVKLVATTYAVLAWQEEREDRILDEELKKSR